MSKLCLGSGRKIAPTIARRRGPPGLAKAAELGAGATDPETEQAR
jgi:hypothetical protein